VRTFLIRGAIAVVVAWIVIGVLSRGGGVDPVAAAPALEAGMAGEEAVLSETRARADEVRAPLGAGAAGEPAEPTASPCASISGRVFRRAVTFVPEGLAPLWERLDAGEMPTDEELRAYVRGPSPPWLRSTERPAVGIEVRLMQQHAPPDREPVAVAFTDPAGSFHFDELPPGGYDLRLFPTVETPVFVVEDSLLARRVVVARGEERSVDFPLPEGVVTVRGRVVDSRGAPIAGAEVRVRPCGDPELHGDEFYGSPRRCPPLVVETDEWGGYVLRGFQPLTLFAAMRFIGDGECTRSMAVLTIAAPGRVTRRIVVPPLTRAVEEDAREWITELSALLARLDPALYGGDETATPYRWGTRPTFRGEEMLLPDVVLPEAATLAGVVVDEGGTRLGEALLRPRREGEETGSPIPLVPGPLPHLEWTEAGAKGAFELPGLDPGDYRFEVLSPGDGQVRAAVTPPVAAESAVRVGDLRVVVPGG